MNIFNNKYKYVKNNNKNVFIGDRGFYGEVINKNNNVTNVHKPYLPT